jgi:hypothetical protein
LPGRECTGLTNETAFPDNRKFDFWALDGKANKRIRVHFARFYSRHHALRHTIAMEEMEIRVFLLYFVHER